MLFFIITTLLLIGVSTYLGYRVWYLAGAVADALEYIEQLETLNSGFPVTKYKKIEPPTKRDFELPPNVKVRSTVYPK